jgi:hypothetical protein
VNDLDPKESYDPTFLFIRADERTEAVEIAVKDIDKEIQHIREDLAAFRHHFNERVEKGVARTGGKNSDAIGALTTRVALLEREQGEMAKQLFDKDTGFVPRMEAWVTNINRLAIGFIVTICAGGLVLWTVKHFN